MRKYWKTFLAFCGIILVVPIGIIFGIVICGGMWWQEVNDTWKNIL